MALSSTGRATRPTSGPSPSTSDWTAVAADRIESAVTKVRDTTTTRLVTAARALVYGLVAAVLGVTVLLLLAIAAIRILDVYLAHLHWAGLNNPPGRSVWGADPLLGGILTLPGLFLLRKAAVRRREG